AIDIDDQDALAARYGDRTLRRLSLAVGLRIRQLLQALIINYRSYNLYYIGLGRFYLLLHDVTLEKAKEHAEQLRKMLAEDILLGQLDLPPGSALQLSITAHLGITWHPYRTLKALLSPLGQRSIADVSSTIFQAIDAILQLGANKGGNIIYAWDPEIGNVVPLHLDK
ncbi:MAG: hypothetical protein J2P36_39725, partial [Ktedonobacteraceae bacterium]|nr:hypothetical protein [Ktedonobacteraceae bacterium]